MSFTSPAAAQPQGLASPDTADRFPAVRIAHTFAPPGESNVRSSFQVSDGVALIGTEETGDEYKTTDGASNLAVINDHTVVVGTGNHAVQGYVYTLHLD